MGCLPDGLPESGGPSARDEHYDYVYDKSGNSTSVLLINGTLAGVWDMAEDKKTLVVKAAVFDRASDSVWHQLCDEAVRLARTAGYASTRVLRCASTPILRDGGQNLFLAPLRDVPGEMVIECQT